MINKAILIGRLTANPELKRTNTGVSVTSFTIAVDRSYTSKDEKRNTDFIAIVCWRSTAEFVCRHFSKGAMIAIVGEIQTRTYQAQDGSNRNVTEVVAESVSFTGEKRENNHSQNYSGSYNNYPANAHQYK